MPEDTLCSQHARAFPTMNRDHLKPATAGLGAELVRAREYRRLTQRGLAAKVGIGRVTLANLEAGRGSVPALVVVLKFLGYRFADQPPETELGRWVAQVRKSAGLSQERLSGQAGIAKFALVRVERGEGNITTLVRAMTALGISLTLVAADAWSGLRRDFIQGDCVEVMQTMPASSVNLVVTSPPYNILKEYEKKALAARVREQRQRMVFRDSACPGG